MHCLICGSSEIISVFIFCSKMIELSCSAIATACQNNIKCQEVFYSAVPRLLAIMEDGSISAMARTKALSAVSCEFSLQWECPTKILDGN